MAGQNGSGQNVTDKMVWTKWYSDKMVVDKMGRTKWYDFILCVHFHSVEFNIGPVFSNQRSEINDKHTDKS